MAPLAVLEIPTGPPVRGRQLWRRTSNFLLIFLQFWVYDLRFKPRGPTTFSTEFQTLATRPQWVNLPDVTWTFRKDKVNTITAEDLAPCATGSSATMVLAIKIMQNEWLTKKLKINTEFTPEFHDWISGWIVKTTTWNNTDLSIIINWMAMQNILGY